MDKKILQNYLYQISIYFSPKVSVLSEYHDTFSLSICIEHLDIFLCSD